MTHDLDFRQALGGAFEPGDVLDGKYRLEELLGVGGMGVVVAARHIELDERVAIKFLARRREPSPEARERFRREARAGFRMSSEHAVRVLDLVFPANAPPYMVLELLDGSDFALLLARHGRFGPDRAVGYILQVCEAVAEAHALGIVHRDLKPDNLFLCRHADGAPCVKVLDFGLAKMEVIDHAITVINKGLGTPQYMAPEQWVSASEVGPAADVWALGVILYQMLTGVCPFDAATDQELSQLVLFASPTPIGDIVPDVPEALAAVVLHCLEKRPKHRYAGVTELASALLPFAAHPSSRAGAPVEEVLALGRRAMASWGITLTQLDALDSDTRVDTPPHIPSSAVVRADTAGGNDDLAAQRPQALTDLHPAPARPRASALPRAKPRKSASRAVYVAAALCTGIGMFAALEVWPRSEAPLQAGVGFNTVLASVGALPEPEPTLASEQASADEARVEPRAVSGSAEKPATVSYGRRRAATDPKPRPRPRKPARPSAPSTASSASEAKPSPPDRFIPDEP
jgi:serine/threonine-protein kinase